MNEKATKFLTEAEAEKYQYRVPTIVTKHGLQSGGSRHVSSLSGNHAAR